MDRDGTQPNENSTDTTTDTKSGEELLSDEDIIDIREEFQRLQGNTLGFDNLLDEGCEPGKLAHYILALRIASWGDFNLGRDPTRIDRDKLRSLVNRTLGVAKDWDELFRTGFGREVIRLAIRRTFRAPRPSERSEAERRAASLAELQSIPQRLQCLAGSAEDIHESTAHRRRPEYDDALAELCAYVELTTRKPHNPELSVLVSIAAWKPEYMSNNIAVWKSEHKDDLERARRRLTQN